MLPVNTSINTPNNPSTCFAANPLLHQLEKLKFEYHTSIRDITLKQWIILQLIDKLTTKSSGEVLKLIVELTKENPDFKIIKTLFQSALRDPEFSAHKPLIIQLDLLVSLQGQHLNTTLGLIFNDQAQAHTVEINNKTDELVLAAFAKVRKIYAHCLGRSEQLRKTYEDYLFTFSQTKKDQELFAKAKPLLSKITSDDDAKYLIFFKEMFDLTMNHLSYMRKTVECSEHLDTLATAKRFQNYPKIIAGLCEGRKAAIDEYAQKHNVGKKRKSDHEIEARNELDKIVKLLDKRFKITKSEQDAIQKELHAMVENHPLPKDNPENKWICLRGILHVYASALMKEHKSTSFDKLLKDLKNLKDVFLSEKIQQRASETITTGLIKIAVEQTADQGSHINNLIEQFEQDISLMGDLSTSVATLCQTILRKKLAFGLESEEDKLAIFNQWDEPVQVKEENSVDEIDEPFVEEIEQEETKAPEIAPQKTSIEPDQYLRSMYELMTAQLPSTQQVRTKELRGHLYLATRGMELLLEAVKKQDWRKIGTVYPMLLIDWHSMLEGQFTGNTESHSLVTRSVGRRLTQDEKTLVNDLDNGLIWSRYPESAIYLQPGAKSQGQLWLMYSLELLDGLEPTPQKINDLLQYAAKAHCQTIAYVAKKTKVKIAPTLFSDAQTAINQTWKVTSIASSAKSKHIVLNQILGKLDKVLKCPLDTTQKTGIVHSALKDVRSHMLRLVYSTDHSKNNVWTARNLKNIQWVLEQLFMCRYYLKTDRVEHIHDFELFQQLLRDKSDSAVRLKQYNFKTAIHRPYLYEKIDSNARQFCEALEKESEGYQWNDEEKPLTEEQEVFVNQGLDLAKDLLDKLISEGNLGKTFVIVK